MINVFIPVEPNSSKRIPYDYIRWIPNATLAPSYKEADLVLFTGGEDIHPSLYNERVNGAVCGDTTSARDIYERGVFNQAVKDNKPILGICRGSQLVCALSRGKLVQHVSDHGTDHLMRIVNKKSFVKTTSTHHQMMYPFNLSPDEYEILAVNDISNGTHRSMMNSMRGIPVENRHLFSVQPEVVYFPKTNALAVQGHPEYTYATSTFRNYCLSLMTEKLFSNEKS